LQKSRTVIRKNGTEPALSEDMNIIQSAERDH